MRPNLRRTYVAATGFVLLLPLLTAPRHARAQG